jgi:hypothetical protein
MSDTPKFEVIDRRKMKAAEEEHGSESSTQQPAAAEPQSSSEPDAPSPGPRLVVSEGRSVAEPSPLANEVEMDEQMAAELPPPSAEESEDIKRAYHVSSQRLEELVRAQNPGVGAQPAVTFPHLVQQFYMSAMIQMGAGTQEGQRPRVDILGAKGTIDLLGVLHEKTKGNLTEFEDRALQNVLFEVRSAFNELTAMINLQAMQPPPPPPGKR